MQTFVWCCKHRLCALCWSLSAAARKRAKAPESQLARLSSKSSVSAISPAFLPHWSNGRADVSETLLADVCSECQWCRVQNYASNKIFIWAVQEVEGSVWFRVWGWILRKDGRWGGKKWSSKELQCSHRSVWNLSRESSLAVIHIVKTQTRLRLEQMFSLQQKTFDLQYTIWLKARNAVDVVLWQDFSLSW